MATVTRENLGLLNDKLVVRVASDDYLPSFQKVLKDYTKKANIPGFRKGMVPVGMVKKMYGSSIFADEVIKSVEKGLQDYMTNEKLEIFANPLPMFEDSPKMDMNEPAEYAFSFEVGLKPVFEIGDPASLHLKKYKVIVHDDMINDQIERMRDGYKVSTEHETITSQDNELTLEFVQTDAEGNPLGEASARDTAVPVKNFTAPIQQQLIGKALNDELFLPFSEALEEAHKDELLKLIALPEDGANTGDLFFQVKVKRIGLLEKPALNEDFFKKVYPDKEIISEAEFRDLIKVELQTQWDSQARNQLLDQVYHELLNHTNIEFPQDFLKRWMQKGMETPKTPEQIEEEFPTFTNQLKWTLITDKLVEDNNIEVGPQDLRDFAKNQLMGYMGGNNMLNFDQPWINDYIDRMMKDKKFVEDSFHRVRTDKVFELLESKISPVETEIAEKDFTSLVEEHHHNH